MRNCKAGQPFGEKNLYKWRKRACENLDIKGVDLYGETRHSSVTALKAHCTPEQIKLGTMHNTNKAFERNFQRNSKDAIEIYSLVESKHRQISNIEAESVISYRKENKS